MKNYSADFETSTEKWNENETWVWAYAIKEIGENSETIYGNNIDDFMNFCENSKNSCFFFNNAKFDFQFIISWLLNNGFEWIKDRKEKKTKTFTTLITEMGIYYSMEVYFEVKGKKVKKATFKDSLKLLTFSVKNIAENFHLEMQKLELDYDEKREKNHELTKKEIKYIHNDVGIVAEALDMFFKRGFKKLTIASNALENFKSGIKNFSMYFPNLGEELHITLKQSYRGGFCYVNKIYQEKEVGEGYVLDVNSLYPHCLRNFEYPYGKPIYYKGKFDDDKLYRLYIQRISCSFKIKKGKIPTIQIKKNIFYSGTEYLESSNGEVVNLTLTSVDLELFLEQYETTDLNYIDGWKFKSVKGLFNKYIDYWTKEKIEGGKEKNYGKRSIAKLFLNSLYGKFASKEVGRMKKPYLDEEGIVRYETLEEEKRDTIYIPVAAFCTSYARNITIRTSQKIRDESLKKYGSDLYCYSDTDSIHTLVTDIDFLESIVNIDDFELGAWKIESHFKRAKFIAQKCYIEEIFKNENETELKITCAGMPERCYEDVTWENFKVGFISSKKLMPKNIKGGVILHETTFEIKGR